MIHPLCQPSYLKEIKRHEAIMESTNKERDLGDKLKYMPLLVYMMLREIIKGLHTYKYKRIKLIEFLLLNLIYWISFALESNLNNEGKKVIYWDMFGDSNKSNLSTLSSKIELSDIHKNAEVTRWLSLTIGKF